VKSQAISRPLRILYVIDDLASGGAEHALLSVAPRLVRIGHDVRVLALHSPYALRDRFVEAGVSTERLDLRSPRSVVNSIAGVGRGVRKYRPDVVHAHRYLATLASAYSKPLAPGPPRIVTFHNLAYDSYPPRTPRRRFRRALERFAVHSFVDESIGVSHAVVRHYTEHLKLKSGLVIYHGVEVPNEDHRLDCPEVRRSFGLAPGVPLLLCAASFRHEKGHHDLIQALAALRADEVDFHLVLAGTGPLEGEIRKAVSNLDLGKWVSFVGHLDQTALAGLRTAADVFVLPSTHEGISVAILEAMASRLPVVATAVGGIPEVVEDGRSGRLVSPAAPRELVSALADVLRNADLRRAWGQRGREIVEARFTIDAAVRRHLALYTSVTGSLVD
jgi:glycosyltransferase involved in cell wall biosynthesis